MSNYDRYPQYSEYSDDSPNYPSIKLKEQETKPYLFLQVVSTILCVATFVTMYFTLYFVMQIFEMLKNARFIQMN